MEPVEIIKISALKVRCDGGSSKGDPLGHPAVYLTLVKKGQIDCPYCGRRFIHEDEATDRQVA